jgi:hypothetical protein|nr:MAG: hypothetical protein KatS3mg041_0236 [Bacteroidota bacterium]
MRPVRMLVLGPHQAGDRMLLVALARWLCAHPDPVVLVHGTSTQSEELFVREGLALECTGSLYRVGTPEAHEALVRSVREWNRRLVALLTENGLPAVGLQGTDRGLLRRDEAVRVADPEWFWKLLDLPIRPVLSALVWHGEQVYLEHPVEVALAIAETHPRAEVVVLDWPPQEKAQSPDPMERISALPHVRDWRPSRLRAPLRLIERLEALGGDEGYVLGA